MKIKDMGFDEEFLDRQRKRAIERGRELKQELRRKGEAAKQGKSTSKKSPDRPKNPTNK